MIETQTKALTFYKARIHGRKGKQIYLLGIGAIGGYMAVVVGSGHYSGHFSSCDVSLIPKGQWLSCGLPQTLLYTLQSVLIMKKLCNM